MSNKTFQSLIASILSNVDIATGYKMYDDGTSADITIEGEPVYIEERQGSFYRVDFTITVPLGNTVEKATNAFQAMLDTPFAELQSKFGS